MVKNKSNEKKHHGGVWFLAIVVIVIIVLIFSFMFTKSDIPQESIDTFAKCITEKGTVMYGAFWCPHCARTKKMFGSSFQYVKYVECDPRGENEQSELCLSLNIDKYDTWIFQDGTRFVSEPTFEILAERSGCSAPGVTG